MGAPCRRLLIAVLLLGVLWGTGCNLASLCYFLLPEGKVPPKCGSMAAADKKKTVKAMVLVLGQDLDLRPETMRVDRQLGELLAAKLREKYKENEEKVELIQPRLIEEYKSRCPDWKKKSPREIGLALKVDYVMVLEITQFGLVAPGGLIYQGQANISVSLVDVHNPDDPSAMQEVSFKYPSVERDMVGDIQPSEFRLRFLNMIAKRLTLYFASHTSHDEYHQMDEF